MSGAAGYILTVTAAAVLAAIVKHLAGQGAMGTLIRFLCGLFLVLTMLSPLLKLELPALDDWLADFRYDGRDAADTGAEMAAEARHHIIKSRMEAYILDKAALYGAELRVDVDLDGSGIPEGVTLEGKISPGTRQVLARWMTTELGIEEEMQHWIG